MRLQLNALLKRCLLYVVLELTCFWPWPLKKKGELTEQKNRVEIRFELTHFLLRHSHVGDRLRSRDVVDSRDTPVRNSKILVDHLEG